HIALPCSRPPYYIVLVSSCQAVKGGIALQSADTPCVCTPGGVRDPAVPEARRLGPQGFFQRCTQTISTRVRRTRSSTSWSRQLSVHRPMTQRAYPAWPHCQRASATSPPHSSRRCATHTRLRGRSCGGWGAGRPRAGRVSRPSPSARSRVHSPSPSRSPSSRLTRSSPHRTVPNTCGSGIALPSSASRGLPLRELLPPLLVGREDLGP